MILTIDRFFLLGPKLLAKYFSGLCHKHFPQSNQLCAESEQLKVAIFVMIWKNRSPSFLQQNKSPSFMMLDYHKDDNDCIIETGKHHALVILDYRLSQLPPLSLNQALSDSLRLTLAHSCRLATVYPALQ